MLSLVSLALVVCWVSLVRAQAEARCGAQWRKGVKVSLNGVRNQTGFWTTEVIVGHDSYGESPSWSFDVESGTSTCVGEKSESGVKVTFITPPPVIAYGYELIPGLGYYKFHAKAEQWPRAKQVCEEEGAHLVIVNSEEESKAMVKLFAQNPNITGSTDRSNAWIGVREQVDANGKYFTIFGEPLASTGYTRWQSGEPNESTMGDYIWMDTNGAMGDRGATAKSTMPFICEQCLL